MRPTREARPYLRQVFVYTESGRILTEDVMVHVGPHEAVNADWLDLTAAERREFRRLARAAAGDDAAGSPST